MTQHFQTITEKLDAIWFDNKLLVCTNVENCKSLLKIIYKSFAAKNRWDKITRY